MMKLFLLTILLSIIFGLINAYPNQELDFEERSDDAIEFLTQKREFDLIKRFLYTGGEQRREVREKYEEKCERKLISSVRNKPRWCPELETWPEWSKLKTPPKSKLG